MLRNPSHAHEGMQLLCGRMLSRADVAYDALRTTWPIQDRLNNTQSTQNASMTDRRGLKCRDKIDPIRIL